MNIQTQYYSLNITFDTPIISQAIGTLAFGLDAAMQRDNQGNPVLSGSLIRGNIRHALEDFHDITGDEKLARQIVQWFGEKTEGNHDYTDRATVEFDFFWQLATDADKQKIAKQHRTRICMDGDKGKVKEAALQVIEDCFPTGTGDVTFRGVIVAHLPANEQGIFQKWLNKTLDYIPAMASFKGIGFGRIKSHLLQPCKKPCQQTQRKASVLDQVTRFGIQLKLDHPFCLGRPKTPDSNRITSSKHIAGNVIKGLIARVYNNDSMRLQEELCFDQLIISHALPTRKNEARQPLTIPLSYGLINKEISDFAFIDVSELPWDKVPSFSPDWKLKDWQKIKANCGFNELDLQHYLSVRTGIDAEHGTSKEGQLFSLDCIDPNYIDNNETEPTKRLKHYVWCADIELCNIPVDKQQQVAENLQKVFNNGLHGIGKTKANACITVNYQKPYKHIPANISAYADGSYVIDIVTSVRMLPSGLHISPINSAKQLKAHYQAYWHQIDEGIQLENYFAQQELESGYYHLKRHGNAANYSPDYLTTAGSVFKLKITSDKAKQALHQCLKTGLPAYDVSVSNKKSWQISPYLPEHGYGEIALHKKTDCKKQEQIL